MATYKSIRTQGLLLGLTLASLGWASAATEQTVSLTIASGGCSGVEVTKLPNKYSYEASVGSISDSSCKNSIRISKLYVDGACINTRDNSIGLDSIDRLTCAEVDDISQATCQKVFSQGPSNALLSLSNITIDTTFESDNVCNSEETGFFFVQSNCTTSATVEIDFTTDKFKGSSCILPSSWHLSSGAVVGIVIAGLIVLFLISWVLFCCCCGSCCCCC